MTAEDDDGLDLVMPFVVAQSKGGPYEDEAFCAGWAMGGLSALLAVGRPAVHEVTIYTPAIPQADLIAMDRGYTVEFSDTDVEGWTYAVFTRAAEFEASAE